MGMGFKLSRNDLNDPGIMGRPSHAHWEPWLWLKLQNKPAGQCPKILRMLTLDRLRDP